MVVEGGRGQAVARLHSWEVLLLSSATTAHARDARRLVRTRRSVAPFTNRDRLHRSNKTQPLLLGRRRAMPTRARCAQRRDARLLPLASL